MKIFDLWIWKRESGKRKVSKEKEGTRKRTPKSGGKKEKSVRQWGAWSLRIPPDPQWKWTATSTSMSEESSCWIPEDGTTGWRRPGIRLCLRHHNLLWPHQLILSCLIGTKIYDQGCPNTSGNVVYIVKYFSWIMVFSLTHSLTHSCYMPKCSLFLSVWLVFACLTFDMSRTFWCCITKQNRN